MVMIVFLLFFDVVQNVIDIRNVPLVQTLEDGGDVRHDVTIELLDIERLFPLQIHEIDQEGKRHDATALCGAGAQNLVKRYWRQDCKVDGSVVHRIMVGITPKPSLLSYETLSLFIGSLFMKSCEMLSCALNGRNRFSITEIISSME